MSKVDWRTFYKIWNWFEKDAPKLQPVHVHIIVWPRRPWMLLGPSPPLQIQRPYSRWPYSQSRWDLRPWKSAKKRLWRWLWLELKLARLPVHVPRQRVVPLRTWTRIGGAALRRVQKPPRNGPCTSQWSMPVRIHRTDTITQCMPT